MVIRFRKKSKSEWLTLFVMVMPFAFFLLVDFLQVTSLVKYSIDVAWIALLLSMLKHSEYSLNIHTKRLAIVVGLFFGLTLIGFLLNFQSPLYYLWGLRNNLRFFVFFFACTFFVEECGIEHYLRFFDVLFWINALVVLYQFVYLGKIQDHLGGIFGVEKGCNAYMCIFLIIITTKSILYYLNQREPALLCLAKCIVSLFIAALSELKFFYIVFFIIIILAVFLTHFSIKKLWMFVAVSVGVVISFQVAAVFFPNFASWFTLSNILDVASSTDGYTSSGDMNRLTTVAIAFERFLPSIPDKLFGLGLGNCDYASFDFLVSPFYSMYKSLNYVWFSTAFLILETGIIGLVLYVLFFIALFIEVGKIKKRNLADPLYCQLSRVMAIVCIFTLIYNASMRTEAAFMMYFILSIPFVQARSRLITDNVY